MRKGEEGGDGGQRRGRKWEAQEKVVSRRNSLELVMNWKKWKASHKSGKWTAGRESLVFYTFQEVTTYSKAAQWQTVRCIQD